MTQETPKKTSKKIDSNSTEKFEYQAEMKQLLNLIIHSLYTHPEVFLRELISNASDALNKIRYRTLTDKNVIDSDAELSIKIELNSKENTFSIEDTGVGMTKKELISNIGTIARSGTLEFLNKIKEGKDTLNEHLIGQFGVGFYSVFMVTDEVIIETRHADADSKGLQWKSKGEGSFTIKEIDKSTRGTKISFKLKESTKEFSQDYKIKETINKYSNFADFPIFLGEEKVNTVDALWRKNGSEVKAEELKEFYKFITNDLEEPFGHLHLSIEGAGASFKALIFMPASAPLDMMRMREQKSLCLYSNKILIQDDCKDLLPEYLRFVKGVVDTSDLPLNVSREVVQSSPVMSQIKNTLTTKILGLLQKWADKQPEKYLTFYRNFGALLKTGINMDFTNRDKLINLLRFHSWGIKRDEMTSLKNYVSRMQKEQKEIYYLSGQPGQTIEMMEDNPNLEYFKKNKIEVLFLTDPVDIFVVPTLNEFDSKPVKSIEKGDLDLMPENKIKTPQDNLSDALIKLFKEVLGDKVEDVVNSKRLVDSAVTLVVGKSGLDTQMERMMKMMNNDSVISKKTLEVNLAHPLIKNLSRMYIADTNNPLIKKCVRQLFEGALFIDGDLPASGDFVKRMTEIMEGATK